MKDALANFPGYALSRASAKMLGRLAERLAPLNLRRADATILVQIEANPGITPSALGQIVAIKRANMVSLVSRLEKSGYISRNALDGRSFALNLTEKGTNICGDVKEILKLHEDRLMARIPEEHRDHFVPALKALWSE